MDMEISIDFFFYFSSVHIRMKASKCVSELFSLVLMNVSVEKLLSQAI